MNDLIVRRNMKWTDKRLWRFHCNPRTAFYKCNLILNETGNLDRIKGIILRSRTGKAGIPERVVSLNLTFKNSLAIVLPDTAAFPSFAHAMLL